MGLEEVLGSADKLLSQRGVVGACYIAATLLAEVHYSSPGWHSWERPDFLFGVLVLSFGASHGSYEGLLGPFQWAVSDRVALRSMRKRVDPKILKENLVLSDGTERLRLETADDMRKFREWLLNENKPRVKNRIETHENARRNSTYLFTSSLGAIVLTLVLPLVDNTLRPLPRGVFLISIGLGLLWFFGSLYRSWVLGRDLGNEYSTSRRTYEHATIGDLAGS